MRGHGPVLRKTVLSRGNVHSRANGPSAGRLKRGLAAALSGGADGDALDAPAQDQRRPARSAASLEEGRGRRIHGGGSWRPDLLLDPIVLVNLDDVDV